MNTWSLLLASPTIYVALLLGVPKLLEWVAVRLVRRTLDGAP